MNSMLNIMPAILSCAGYSLTDDEKAFFHETNPMGFILFAKNIQSEDQVRELISDLRNSVGDDREFIPILIDQEGGVVDRLKHLEKSVKYKEAIEFGVVAKVSGVEMAQAQVFENAHQISARLRGLGVNVNCAPVADLYDDSVGIRGTGEKNPAIGGRSFSDDVDTVVALAKSFIHGQLENNVISVVKHLPGHGLATVDSHKSLPIVSNNISDLESHDFKVFQELAGSKAWGMVGHIVYEVLDADHPASQSKADIEYIRGLWGSNVLVSDAIEMSALSGSMGERALESLRAGLDLVIYGAGNLDEMRDIANVLHDEGTDVMPMESWDRIMESVPLYNYGESSFD